MNGIGIDIGGASVKLAATDGAAVLWTRQTPPHHWPSAEALVASIRAAVADVPVDPDAAIGLCVPGLLNAAATRVELSVNVPGLMELPLVELVARAMTAPDSRRLAATLAGRSTAKPRPASGAAKRAPLVLNDAVAGGADFAASAELAGRVLVLSLGTGVGMAVLDDGVPLIVEGRSPGHVGQVDVSLADAPIIGPDGGAGGLEGYVGVPALIARYGDAATALKAMAADPAAPPLRALARAIRICHAIYRPDHVGLIGGIGIRLAPALDSLRALVARDLTRVARDGWTLACGVDDFHAARGVARLATASCMGATV